METVFLPTTPDIRAIVEDELTRGGGTVSECFDDGSRLFLRSVLPAASDIRPGDRVQAGVAVMTAEDAIRVHPYIFRQICSNGAIFAQTIQTRIVRRSAEGASDREIDEVGAELREALRVCSAAEAFDTTVAQIRSTLEIEADLAIGLSPLLYRLSGSVARASLARIVRRFAEAHDGSVFGLMNAFTSVARDERDPDTRWRLEELGGGLVTLGPFTPQRGTPAARHEPVSVG